MIYMDVVIDSREQKRIKLAKEYYTKQGHEVQVKELKTGDYLFENKVVFEFKTIQDFISSILNGRVFNEAIEQCYNYKYQFIIIQGSNRDRQQAIKETNKHQKFLINQYYGAIARLNTYSTVIQSTGTLNDAFLMMEKQTEKILDDKPITKKFYTKSPNPAYNALCYCLDDVHEKRAKNIVNTLNLQTWSDVYHLTYTDLVNVPGIGEILAKQIIGQINQMG